MEDKIELIEIELEELDIQIGELEEKLTDAIFRRRLLEQALEMQRKAVSK